MSAATITASAEKKLPTKDIVELFLDKGILIAPAALEALQAKSEDEIYNILTKATTHYLTPADLSPPKPAFEILKNLIGKPKEATKDTLLQFYNSKYTGMKQILTERLGRKEFVSPARIPLRGEMFMIGIVKDIREAEKVSIDLEDPAGTATVVFDTKPDCDLDEVVCVRATAAGRIIFGKEIIYPDIPLRAPAKGEGRGCFISDLHLDEAPASDFHKFVHWADIQDIDWLFIAGDLGEPAILEEITKPTFIIPSHLDSTEQYPQLPLPQPKNRHILPLSNPAMLHIGGLNILMIHEFNLGMLKKRHLGKSPQILPEDFLILDHLPDIVHHGHDHKPFVNNYKSTTIVNAGSLLTQFRPVVVDFKTRDWKQVTV